MQKIVIFSAGLLGLAATAAQAAEVTIYNQGPSVVTEARSINLKAGAQDLAWPDLPEQILPQTLLLQGQGVELTGSRYLRDSLNAQTLLERREGRSVVLLREDGQGGDVARNAQLVSASRPLIVRVDDRIEVLDANSPWRVALDSLPPDLPASAAMLLRVNAKSAGKQSLRLTYQVDGLTWNAEYVGRYDDAKKRLTLRGAAVLQNNSGGGFADAGVDLIAGDIARSNGGGPRPVMMRAEAFKSDAAPQASPAFEYYRYDLPGKISLLQGETRSVSLFDSRGVEVEREYRLEDGWRSNGDVPEAHPDIRLSFENTLERPLPAGNVRVYDGANSPLLLGEDAIGHTPEGQSVSLTLGEAFDITGQRRVTEDTRDGQSRESERRIVISNAKDESVQVRVVERLPGDWEILSESLPHNKLDANRAVWVVGVPAGGKAVLNYRVRYR